MTTRRAFVSSATGAMAAKLFANQSASRPNFIIIYTDDQGLGDVGCYGAQDVKTPNMDWLAEEGVRFTEWYSNSPVCSPSRASLLTGKYPQRAGVPDIISSESSFNVPGLRPGEVTLASELRRLGYRTAVIGKWHLGSAPHSRPLAQGFDEFFGYYSGWTDAYSHRYYRCSTIKEEIFHDLWHNEEEVWADSEYQTDLFSRKAREFLLRQSNETPFFLYLAYGAPHFPMMAPRKYLDRFPASMDRDRRMHAAMLAAVDDGIGEILSILRSRGMDRNTVIFFQSDNGATNEMRADHRGRRYQGGSNAPFRGYKAGLFEGGIRMPAMMCWLDRIPAGKVVREVGVAMDIFPTFLAWADLGRQENEGIDGRNVEPMVLGNGRSPHDAVFWAYSRQLAVREGDWKLIVNPPSLAGEQTPDPTWLSNLREDPGEKRNWSRDQRRLVSELRRRIDEWQQSLA